MIKLSSHLLILALAGTLMLSACSDTEQTTANTAPQAFNESDECHVCGMIIDRFPGPKGQGMAGQKQTITRKFCSTRDLFSWYFQPDIRPNVTQMYVHDMGRSDWTHPDDRHLMDAKSATYVIGSAKKGAMGPTLAAFADPADANAFAEQHGGSVVKFSELTLDIIHSN